MVEESLSETKKNSWLVSQQSGEVYSAYNLSPKNYSGYIFTANASGINIQHEKNSQAA